MAKRKSRSPAESVVQKKRTHFNQKNKYEKMISMYPDSPHVKKWEQLVEYYSKN